MMRTSRESALLIALLFKRSGKSRIRISKITVKKISKRKHLRMAFVEQLTDELDDLGVVFIEIERGGYGLIPTTALNGAPPVSHRKLLKELRGPEKNNIDFDAIQEEVASGLEDEEDEDD